MVDICNKYENLRNIDKIGMAHEMVEDVIDCEISLNRMWHKIQERLYKIAQT
jgi:hypothetical protein